MSSDREKLEVAYLTNSKFFNLGVLNSNMNMTDTLSPLGSPIVLQRKGSVYGANVPMITG